MWRLRTNYSKIAFGAVVLLLATVLTACVVQPTPQARHNEPIAACSGPVKHIAIEEGHVVPYPVLVPPDVEAYGETPRLEWNYLGKSGVGPLVVHCYTSKNDSQKTDVPIPPGVRQCIFESGDFRCD